MGRHRTVLQFKQGRLGPEHGCAESKVLITTDMYSRGYDVPAVSPSHSRHLHDLRLLATTVVHIVFKSRLMPGVHKACHDAGEQLHAAHAPPLSRFLGW